MADDEDLGVEQIRSWFAARLPGSWGVDRAEIVVDADEVLVVLHLPTPADGAPPVPVLEAEIARFREATRDERMMVARAAESAFRRKISWGAAVGSVTVVFSTASVPVMTRLRLPERRVLDTLIDAGVARSRSDALAWCVRLVGDNEQEWIAELRQAFTHVMAVRARGPKSRRGPHGEE